jgi:hypothetical protein
MRSSARTKISANVMGELGRLLDCSKSSPAFAIKYSRRSVSPFISSLVSTKSSCVGVCASSAACIGRSTLIIASAFARNYIPRSGFREKSFQLVGFRLA